MRQTLHYIRQYYGTPAITCDDYPQLLALMHHDKKNTGTDINVTLLSDVGEIHINQIVGEEEISEALDFLREGGAVIAAGISMTSPHTLYFHPRMKRHCSRTHRCGCCFSGSYVAGRHSPYCLAASIFPHIPHLLHAVTDGHWRLVTFDT